MNFRKFFCLYILLLFLFSCNKDDDASGDFQLVSIFLGESQVNLTEPMSIDMPVDRSISIVFSIAVDASTVDNSITLSGNNQSVPLQFNVASNGKSVTAYPQGSLFNNTIYTLTLSADLRGAAGQTFPGADITFKTIPDELQIISFAIGEEIFLPGDDRITDVPLNLSLVVNFSTAVDPSTVEQAINFYGPGAGDLVVTMSNSNQTATLVSTNTLDHLQEYTLSVSDDLKGAGGEPFEEFLKPVYTAIDPEPKFDLISDEDLLTLIQQQTFKYFWDFGHPASGMARERNSSGDIVTSGGTGFGLMSIIVGIERGFITRAEGVERITKIVDFLADADRFHGAWPHWMNGATGAVVPFSPNDNGGDLVETAFLVQGLLTVRQYLDVATESSLITKINSLWNSVEWDWYTRGGEDVLYWHWSPNLDWIMNHQIRGHNETLITYVLAASSTTHAIDADVYHDGYARSGGIENGKSFYGITLPLGEDYGGPLFFTHYSFLGLDPRNLEDQYANYWTQNVNHTLINRAYVIDNPRDFVGYSEDNWGLTASDNHSGYSAHSPSNDLGVITPTAALSSFPYSPEYSMDALKFFYYTVGDKLWGDYGFYDAYNPTEGWVADSYLAIDQGPIIVMIENHRTGLLWELFMSAPEVQEGLTFLGFTY
jgi:hypothetical protein